jgi:hypothetical protein
MRSPGSELRCALGNHQKTHVRMLRTAKLRALSFEAARSLGTQEQHIVLTWDRVALAAQAWHPKAVDDVGRDEFELDRTIDGNVKLVSGAELGRRARHGISKFPPPLV